MGLWRAPRFASPLFAALAILTTATSARAQFKDRTPDPPFGKLVWDAPRFSTAEWVTTSVFGAAAIASLAVPRPSNPWTSVTVFDDAVRRGLRFNTLSGREAARDLSDVLLAVNIDMLIVDSALVTWWGRSSGDVAFEMGAIDAETLAVTTGITGMVASLSGRERPYRHDCNVPEPLQNEDCRNSKRYRSFFSGHTSTSFAAAGLTCMHHAHFGLYGSIAADSITCVASFASASVVGAMRVAADQHWASDVLTGATVGTLTGLGIPWLLHYRSGLRHPSEGGVSVRVLPMPLGAQLIGEF